MSFFQKLFGPPNIENLQVEKDVGRLIKALKYTNDRNIQIKAALALGQIGDSRAIKPLLQVADDWTGSDNSAHKQLVRSAVEALGQIGDIQAIKPLAEVAGKWIDFNNFDVAFPLIRLIDEVLSNLGHKDITKLEALLKKNTSGSVRAVAARALGRMENSHTHALLMVSFEKDENLFVRLASYSALEPFNQNNGIFEQGVKELIELVAIQLRSLHSRTRLEISYEDGEYLGTAAGALLLGPPIEREYEVPDPDIRSIRRLIAWTPTMLRDQVRLLSGEADQYF